VIRIVFLVEALLLAAGFLLDRPLLSAVAGLGLAYLMLAYSYPDLAWALVWLAFPFSIEMLFPGGHALQVPTEPMIFLAILAWTARSLLVGSFRLPRSGLHAPLAFLGAASLVPILFGAYVLLCLKALSIAAVYVVFGYLYVVLTWRDASRAMRLVPWIVGSGAAWGLYGLARIISGGGTSEQAYGAARPFFTEHGAYAAYLAMILPLALLLTLERRGWTRAAYASATLIMSLAVILCLTRASWVGLAFVLPPVVAIWSWRRRSFRPVAVVAALAVMVVVILSGIGYANDLSRHARSITSEHDVSNLERINRWMAAIEMVKARPWLGFGYASYPSVYPEFRRKTVITELAYQYMSPHSELFRLLAESGFVGFFAACWFLTAAGIAGWRVYRRSPDSRDRLLSLAILAALGTYVIHGLFRTYIDLEKVAVPFWASLGVIAAMEHRLRDTPQ
jgi:hypothetical protein